MVSVIVFQVNHVYGIVSGGYSNDGSIFSAMLHCCHFLIWYFICYVFLVSWYFFFGVYGLWGSWLLAPRLFPFVLSFPLFFYCCPSLGSFSVNHHFQISWLDNVLPLSVIGLLKGIVGVIFFRVCSRYFSMCIIVFLSISSALEMYKEINVWCQLFVWDIYFQHKPGYTGIVPFPKHNYNLIKWSWGLYLRFMVSN